MVHVVEARKGKGGIELASLDWLLLHHRVKLQDRQEIIRKFDIQAGNHVLDLGCGPGLWTQLLADAVGVSGRIIGIDFDQYLLSHAAHLVKQSHPQHDVSFRQMDFTDLADLEDDFDVVFFSNCFCYLPDPSPLISQMKRITRPGGRVIGRNWDGDTFLLYPMDERLLATVQYHLLKAIISQTGNAYFDHYFGRKMPGLFRRHGFNHVTCCTQVIERSGVADSDLATYIKTNGEWMHDQIAGSVDQETLREWRAHFDPGDKRCIYKFQEFYFCMTETAVIGYV